MSRFDHDLIQNIDNIADGAQVLIIDVDGVLMDNRERLHYITEIVDGEIQYKEKPDWKTYEKEAPNDKPMLLCRSLKRLTYIYDIIFLTARNNDDFQTGVFERAIQPFMGANGNWYYRFKDTPPSQENAVDYKRRVVTDLQDRGIEIVLAIDDSLSQIEMYKSLGICALRCHDTITDSSMFY